MLTKNDLSLIKTVVQETIKPEIKVLGSEIESLKQSVKTVKQNMSTKDDMKNLEGRLKSDMKQLEIRIVERIEERVDEAQMEIIATVDRHKADKESIKVLEKRIDRLEENADLPPYLD